MNKKKKHHVTSINKKKKHRTTKKRHHTMIYYITVCLLTLLFIFTSISVITMQTVWGREKVKTAFILFAKKNNINVKIESVKGLIPFEYKFKNLTLYLEDQKIEIKNLDCRIKVISFLKKKLTFKSFIADDISVESKTSKRSPQKELPWISFPVTVELHKLKLNNLYFKNQKPTIPLYVSGKARIEKNGNIITSDLIIKRKEYANSYLDISFKGTKETRLINLKAYLNVNTIKALDFIIKKEDFDISFDLNFTSQGNLDSYLGFLEKSNNIKYPKIQGYAYGNIFDLQSKIQHLDFIIKKKTRFEFDFFTSDNLNINISKGLLINDLLKLDLDAKLTKSLTLDNSTLLLEIEHLSKVHSSIPVFGSFHAQIDYNNNQYNSTYSFENFKIKDIFFMDFKGSLNGQYQNNALNGSITTSFFTLDQIFNISSVYNFEKLFLNLSDLQIDSPSSKLRANLTLTPAFHLIGGGTIHIEDLKQIQIFYPNLFFYGASEVNFDFKQKLQDEKAIQNLLIKIHAPDYHFKTLIGKTLDISMDIDDPFIKPLVDFKIDTRNLRFRELYFNKFTFTTSTKEENWPYKLHFDGKLKKPFKINSNGFWKMNKDEFIINTQDINGHLFEHNFITTKPIKLEATKNSFLLSDFSLELEDSSIYADVNFTKSASKAKINLKHVPLEFLSINPLDLDISGYATLNLNLDGPSNDINSKIDLDLEELNVLTLGEKAPLQINGKLKSEIQNNYFNFDGFLNLKETQFFTFKGNIPLNIDLVKLNVLPNENKTLFLDLKYKGKTEEVVDLLNVGPQRLEGDLDSQIELSNKLRDLEIKGFCTLTNGYYENYYTGTIIKDFKANFKMSNEKIILEKLSGKDPENGEIFAEGLFSVSKRKNFPFYFKTQIKNFLCLDSDIFEAKASAHLEITGDRLSSLAKGNIFIDKLNMTIPDKLPVIIPNLKPIFIYHPYQQDIKKEKEKPAIYPLHLNLDIDATTTPISINGQGLTSTWEGLFKIGGTYMNVEARGGLKLLKGKFEFSGRKFILTKGSVIFDGKPNAMPLLEIQAKTDQHGVDIFANMKGPIDRPKLFFTSSPPLPASSILSLLIFGQQVSDLTTSQTLDLSSSMSSMLDPSTLSEADSSSSLGLDRFNMVQSTSNDPYGSDQVAMQLGKYISRGIVISVSQGEEQGSQNVIIEVDLKKGLIFQAESQQQQEQGKFSLKYRYNY